MRSRKIFYRITKGIIIVLLILRACQLIVRFYNVYILHHIIQGNEALKTKLHFIQSELEVEEKMRYFTILPFVICLSVWLYLSYKKAVTASRVKLSYKPLLALFAFMIPFFNLFGPYKIMNEIWTVRNRDMSKEKQGKDRITIWWFLTIAIALYTNYWQYKTNNAANLEEYLYAEYLAIILFLVTIHYLTVLLRLLIMIENQPEMESITAD
jgi:hypothetical protein